MRIQGEEDVATEFLFDMEREDLEALELRIRESGGLSDPAAAAAEILRVAEGCRTPAKELYIARARELAGNGDTKPGSARPGAVEPRYCVPDCADCRAIWKLSRNDVEAALRYVREHIRARGRWPGPDYMAVALQLQDDWDELERRLEELTKEQGDG